MFTGRRASDWLRDAASGQDRGGDADDRRGSDRRFADRRAPRRAIDPLFATTLLNHLLPIERERGGLYLKRPSVRPGIAVNLWA
jgi:hypothetical protein